MAEALSRDTPVFKLPHSVLNTIANRLLVDEQWKELAGKVKRKRDGKLKFSTAADIKVLEAKALAQRQSPSEALLNYLGTQQFTISDLTSLLVQEQFYWVADYLHNDVLKEGPAPRVGNIDSEEKEEGSDFSGPPSAPSTSELGCHVLPTIRCSPHAQSNLYLEKNSHQSGHYKVQECISAGSKPEVSSYSSSSTQVDVNRYDGVRCDTGQVTKQHMEQTRTLDSNMFEEFKCSSGPTETIEYQSLIPGQPLNWSYHELQQITSNFDERLLKQGGRLIGKGGFGQVFLGLPIGAQMLAIKRFFSTSTENYKQFMTEVGVMAKLRNENLLPLLGYCNDTHLCIVYPYMANGSLEYHLHQQSPSQALSWEQRVKISLDIANGIGYLHENDLTHRDIKSANVLLDGDFVAKLGDFGLARFNPHAGDPTRSGTLTTVVIGTPGYMAPEAIFRKISPKLDIYSYGVILLELLTGLPALDNEREEPVLVDHMRENFEDVMAEVDKRAGSWPEDVAIPMYKLAEKCVDHRAKRPSMPDIIELVSSWKN